MSDDYLVPIENITVLVRPQVPNVPAPMLLWAIIQAASQFSEETKAVRDTVIEDLTEGFDRYKITPSSDFDGQLEVIGIRSVRANGVVLNDPAAPGEQRASGSYIVYAPDDLSIVDPASADVAGGLSVEVVLRVVPTADRLPKILTQLYRNHVAAGALWILKSMAEKPWTDGPGAAMHYERFENYKDQAREDAARQHRVRNYRTQPVRWR